MNQCTISNEEWLGRLVNCLTGKALAVYHCRTRETDEETYETLKEKILVALGHRLQQTRKKFWNPSRKYLDMPMDALCTLDSSYSSFTRDCVDMNALREELLTGRLLLLCPWDIADIIYTRNPASSYEAVKFLQSYLDNHPWQKYKLDITRHREVSGFGGGVGVAGGDPGMGGGKSYRENHSKKRYFNKEYIEGVQGKDDQPFRRENQDKLLVCFGCGVKGHRKSECPDRVATIKKVGQSRIRTLPGTVGTNLCTMTLDSDHTVARAVLITDTDYTGRTKCVGDYYGYWQQIPTASVC